ncbi:peptide-methionine (S)-S-oxide reductase MsrA [Nocardioides marmotae]|uniref:Peptide methionine sulfoxide reductase MsrA n=1 Tax=Nocardioides marmotae TaxID=2663857 RepID=A0A6I3J7P8_9ACTN|nr:peptide-methionine (S)-S-oxide reductase MsrA [Nocardioides marmotae]MCR6030513.1 peptide-methionine (S)-S-oxide reductase MsrA [Gordonia jinghuaiqii]MBC9734644.1 peptide-methionine (S)-S-oxide reductase MsrA [Nocardioides marmotae]MTB85746.1 peptide-methionine (S)-S-oxide reductase MsrA [Nocardioides marmotae]MTB94149.1 peptide-methionine (S)-S-oxide reductase MsrA [Nocardioides marmotae]QKE00445.1 peptide-methionine (S)-S-oxide reductase MsrA [Nocardioides marmotae]
MFFARKQTELIAPEQALPGRTERWFHLADRHLVLGTPLVTDEAPEGMEVAVFGLGCFWGAEEVYWQLPGVWSTSVGYAGGTTPNPSYEEVCSGATNHTEAVRVVFDPSVVSYADLVKRFFEVHDPTQGMRQGNDVGTQYRSAIYWTTPEQEQVARELTEVYAAELRRRGLGEITTEIREVPTYYYAEDAHQQYLAKNPHGYRCHANTGVKFPQTA